MSEKKRTRKKKPTKKPKKKKRIVGRARGRCGKRKHLGEDALTKKKQHRNPKITNNYERKAKATTTIQENKAKIEENKAQNINKKKQEQKQRYKTSQTTNTTHPKDT